MSKRIPLSIPKLARIFGVPELPLRSLVVRRVIELEIPFGGWASISAQDLVAMAAVLGARKVGLRGRRLKAIWSLVQSGFEEANATGFKPILVLDPVARWMRIFLAIPGQPPMQPPAGVVAIDLAEAEARYAKAIEKALGERSQPAREAALREAVTA